MKTINLKPNLQLQFHGRCHKNPATPPPPVITIPKKHHQKAFNLMTQCIDKLTEVRDSNPSSYKPSIAEHKASPTPNDDGKPRLAALGPVSLGLALVLMGMDDHHQALALGPEGPLVEEFWDNVRRYGLYALTVSTGALYTILLPIFELLKNPISAVLVIVILGGGFFIVSQVLYAMVGVTDFSYDYGY